MRASDVVRDSSAVREYVKTHGPTHNPGLCAATASLAFEAILEALDRQQLKIEVLQMQRERVPAEDINRFIADWIGGGASPRAAPVIDEQSLQLGDVVELDPVELGLMTGEERQKERESPERRGRYVVSRIAAGGEPRGAHTKVELRGAVRSVNWNLAPRESREFRALVDVAIPSVVTDPVHGCELRAALVVFEVKGRSNCERWARAARRENVPNVTITIEVDDA